MGNNSIRVNLSKEDIISDINLMSGANTTTHPVFLVVEGRDDIIFFQSRIKNDVNLYESFSGCEGVKEIVESFSANNVIGICDRDYDNSYINEHIFFYDYNCLEMMLASNDVVFGSVCATCYAGELSSADLRSQILNDLKLISILRKINFDYKVGINFNMMSINKLYCKLQKKIDVSKIKNPIQSNIIIDKRAQVAQLLSQIVTYEQLLQVTNGHDFISYLQLLFDANKPAKSKSVNIDTVFKFLSVAFRKEDFMGTIVYQNLKQFESSCNLTLLN